MSPSDTLLEVKGNHLGAEQDGQKLQIGSIAHHIKLPTKKMRI